MSEYGTKTRSWLDQPLEVEGVPIKIRTFTGDRIVELRSDGNDRHYMTAGNLFGSQTVACQTLDDAFRVFNIASETSGGQQASLPAGCKIIERDNERKSS